MGMRLSKEEDGSKEVDGHTTTSSPGPVGILADEYECSIAGNADFASYYAVRVLI